LFAILTIVAMLVTALVPNVAAQGPDTAVEPKDAAPAEKPPEDALPDGAGIDYAGGPDGYGYAYQDSFEAGGPTYNWIDAVTGGTNLLLDDTTEANITLPFSFTYYGTSSTALRVGNNGAVLFGVTTGDVSDANSCPMSGSTTNNIFGPWWDDWATTGDVYWQVFGTTPNQYVVIEWYNMAHYTAGGTDYATFELILYEGSTDIVFQYQDTDVTGTAYDNGLSGTVGVHGASAANTLQYRTCNTDHLAANLAIRYYIPIVPNLGTSYKSAPPLVTIGDVFTYTVHIANTGFTTATAASLSDVLPAGTDYVADSVDCSAGNCAYLAATDEISWTGSVAVGASVVVTFAVDTVDAPCGNLVNTAVLDDPGLLVHPVNKQATTMVAYQLPFLQEGFENLTFPPAGWAQVIVNDPGTDPVWTRETVGTSPTINPHSGAAMVKFNSYNAPALASARLYTPALDLSTAQMPALRFWMSYYSSATNDRITIQASTDGGTNWTDLTTFARYDATCTTACWKQNAVDLAAYAGQSSVQIGFLGISAYGYNIFIDDVTVAEPWSLCPYISLGPDQMGTACPGNTASYVVPVSNMNDIADTLDLSWTNVWPTTISPTSFSLGIAGTGTANVSVYVPWAQQVGDSDMAPISVAAQTSGLTDQATIKTTVPLATGWTDLASNPHGMRQSGVVYYNGKLYVIGGYTGSAATYVDIYDIATNTWTSGTPVPVATSWWDCVEIGGKIYCAGGYTTAGQTTLRIYDIATNSWTTGAAMSAMRYSYAGVAVNGKYYVIGGYTGSYMNTIWAYDPAMDTWNYSLPNMTTARRYHMAGVIGTKIYVVGGYSGSYQATMEVFDTTTNTWSAGTSMPLPWLNAADGVKHDRYLVLTGGGSTSTSAQTNRAWAYDAVADTWTEQATLPRALYAAEGDSDGTHYWMVGGYSGTSYIGNTTRMEQCASCTPLSGPSFTVAPTSPRPGNPATFSGSVAAGSLPISYEWDFGDGTTGTGQTVDHTYASAATYTVVMTATNCDGANFSVATQDIVVMAGPLANISPLALEATQCPASQTEQTLSICNDGDQPLTWEITHTGSIPWVSEEPTSGSLAAGECATVTVTFDSADLEPGIYTGTLEIETNDVLNPEVAVALSLTVAGPPTGVDFSYTPPQPWMNQNVAFDGTATALMPVDYAWSFGDGAYGTGQNPTHAYAAAGTYTVVMTATQCGSTVTATHMVTVIPCWSLLTEDFEGTFPPANWQVVNNGGTCVWMRNDAFATARPNYAGGLGFCADADADKCGSGTTMNTELRTMVLDLSGLTTATLEYVASYNWLSGAEFANTDVSIDGGTTWTNLLHWTTDHSAYGPGELVTLDLTQFQGEPSVMIRFHYYAPGWDYWFEVDQVNVFGCYVPTAVPDIIVDPTSLTQALLVNQTAMQTFNVANVGLGVLDWTLDEGCGTPVGWLSETPTSGTLNAYHDTDVEVTFDSTGLTLGTYNTTLCVNSNDPDEPSVSVDVTLIVTGTPDIAVTPASLETTLCQGDTDTQYLTICNQGTGPLVWSLSEVPAGLAVIPVVTGNTLPVPASPAVERPVITSPEQCAQYENYTGLEPIGAAEFCNKGVVPPAPSGSVPLAPTDTGYAQDIGYISDSFVTFALNNFTGQTVVGTSTNAYYGLDFDPSGTVLYALNDTTDQLGTINLTTGAFTGLVPCLPGGGAANWTGLAIDPVSGVFYGSTATDLYIIDPTTGNSTLVGPFGTTTMIAIAVNAQGQMYGHDITSDSIYQINPATGAATLIGLTGYAANYAQGMDFDNDDGTLYIFLYIGSGANVYGTVNLTTGAVTPLAVSAPLGEFEGATQTVVSLGDIPWLTEVPTNSVLMPGECVDVAVTFDSDALPTGGYTGDLLIESNDADEPEVTISVQMTVLEAPSGADFLWSPLQPIIGETVYFSGTVTGGSAPLTWSWNFGDGETATGQYATHVYAAPGDYLVTLTVANTCGQDVAEYTVMVIGEADIVVTPSSLSAAQCPDATTTMTVTICNEGIIPLDWAITEAPPVRLSGLTATPAAVSKPRQVELKLDAAPGSAGSVATNPPVPDAPVALVLDDGSRDNDIGIGGTWEFIWANRFTPAAADFPFMLNEVQIYFSSVGLVNVGDNIILAVYENTTGSVDPAPGSNLLATFPATVQAVDSWNVYTLATPVLLSGPGDVIIGVIGLEIPGTSYWPASIDQTATQQRSWAGWWLSSPPPDPPILPPDDTWILIDAYFPGNWMVRGYGETYMAYDIPWLSEDPTSGSVPPGECTVVDVTFDSTGLALGDYLGNLVITSNDPDTPEVTIPVQLTVLEPATIAGVTYTTTGLQVAFDATVTGGAPLTYAWTFGDGGTSNLEDPTHTYLWTGCYPVTLVVSSGCGQDTWQAQVCVCEAVAGADFSWFPTAPWVGEMVDFSGSITAGSPPFTWSWDFGDGTRGSGQYTLHAYATPGDHLVTLTVRNGCGRAVAEHTVTIRSQYYYYLPIITRNYAPEQ
jgi:uncharacterized repeat protein (TIGR01451 family)